MTTTTKTDLAYRMTVDIEITTDGEVRSAVSVKGDPNNDFIIVGLLETIKTQLITGQLDQEQEHEQRRYLN